VHAEDKNEVIPTMALDDDLNAFTGSEHHYRHFTGLRYTDGIRYLAEHAGAYWLIDLVASYQPRLRNVPFQLWELTVNDDHTALATMREDTHRRARVRQDIEYTDFPLRSFSWYCTDNVMMLKSEY
jgi:hypothetical protein